MLVRKYSRKLNSEMATCTVQYETYLVPRIGMSILSIELGVILLSIVQKVGYDCAMDDQKKAVQAFVVGKDVFLQSKSNCPSRIEQRTRFPWLATRPRWVNNLSRQ